MHNSMKNGKELAKGQSNAEKQLENNNNNKRDKEKQKTETLRKHSRRMIQPILITLRK